MSGYHLGPIAKGTRTKGNCLVNLEEMARFSRIKENVTQSAG